MSLYETDERSTQADVGVPLFASLATTSALQKHLQEIAPLLGTQPHLHGITKLKDGVFAYRWISEFGCLRTDILNSDYEDTVAKTGAVIQEPKPNENSYPRATVLLLHKARLHTRDDEIFLLQRFPIDTKTQEAINRHILKMDPTLKTASVTNMNTKLFTQSLTVPAMKGEAPLQSDSLCLVLQNVDLEIVPQLVPFLLVPRLTSKVEVA